MKVFALAGLINGIGAILFGLLVLWKNKKSFTHQIFAVFSLVVAFWSLSYFFWLMSDNYNSAYFWVRNLSLGANFIPILYLHWILALLDLNKKKRWLIRISYALTFVFSFFSYSSFYISELRPIMDFKFWPKAGPLYIFYISILYIGLSGYGVSKLLNFYKKSTGTRRNQLQYLIIGSIIGFSCGFFNFPLWYGILIKPYLNFGIIIYTAILTYAIVKYRLMDIRFVLGRGAVYGFSLLTIVAFAFLLIFLNNLLANPVPINIAWPIILIVCILLFQPIFRFFEKLASKYFYYTFYSYQTILTDLGRKLTRVLDLEKLSSLVINTLMETMKLDRTVILLREPETGDYQIQKNIGFKEENGISLVKDDFLTQYLEKTQAPLVYEELSLIIRDTTRGEERERLKGIREDMGKIEASLCLPLFIEEKIIGMVVLGNKISKEPYSVQDIELLTSLSNQASIAFQNARLYSQVEDLSQNLQEKVDEQTKELRKAYEELKVLDKAKSEFISMASHQLRTPLSAIKGYISMLVEGSYGEISEKAKEKLKNVFQSNERLIKIVNDLLDISKVEMGKMELERAPAQLEDLIQSCYEEMKIGAEKKNLKFILKKPKTPLPKIEIDSLKMRQVFLNLIDNAIRYTQKGKIEIEIKKIDSRINVSVGDTGEGLSLKEKRDVFEGFTRGSAGIAYFIEGAGLGLYVAKKFLELQKGKIWMESEGKGKGSTFYVELPLK